MTPLLHFSAGSIRLVPQSTFKNTKKETQLNKCNFTRRPLLLRQPAFSLNWISTRNVSKTRILTSAVEADVAVEAEPNPKQETSEEPEPVSEQTEEATSTSTSADVKVKQVRPGRNSDLPRVKNEDLVPGATFTGTVRSIQPFGLFVDFGAFTEGLVHISQISSSYVKDVKALFTIGQEVEVRLMEANMETSRISLTMRAPGDEKRRGPPSRGGTGTGTGTGTGAGKGGRRRQERRRPRIGEGDIIIGTVKEITGEGALVTLPGGEDGVLPVSEQVAAVYGSEAGSTLEAGQEIEVRVLSMVEGKVTLTMKEEQFMEKELLAKKREEEEFFKVDIDREFEVLEQIGVEYEEVEEGEEGGGEDTGEVVEEAATGDPTVDVDDGTIVVNPFVFTFLRSRYAANAEKRLELIGGVKKAGSVVAVKAASVSGVAGDGSTVGSASVGEEPVAVGEVDGGEVAAVGAVSEAGSAPIVEEPVTASEQAGGESGSVTDSNLVKDSASVVEEAVAVSELAGSEVLAVGAVPEAASGAGSVSVAEEPVAVSEEGKGEVAEAGAVPEVAEKSDSTASETSNGTAESTIEAGAVPEVTESELTSDSTASETSTGTAESTIEAPVVEELVAATSEVEGGEVAAARVVPEVPESEASSEIGSVSVAEEPIAAAGSVPEVAESEVASDSTVTEASIGATESTGEASIESDNLAAVTSKVEVGEVAVVGAASDSTGSETKTEEVADEEAASIRVGDEKPEVSEATPEATPNQAPEVKATISPSLVKELREETGAGMMDCKKALAETNGDVAKAQEYLRKKGLASADKRASRATAEGRIGAYVHDGRIGVLIEVNCETDFVSRGDIFKELVEDLAMQVAACPQVTYVTSEEVPEETVKKEKEIEMQREDILSKPENIREKIVEGRIRKRLEEFALLEQPYIKSDDKVVVKDHVKQTIAKIGENIKVNRFVRFNLGEGLEKKTQDFAAEVAAQTAAKPDVATAVAAPPKDEEAETTETAEKAPTSTVKISPALVKELREETGAGMMDCKKALAETGGEIEKAQEYLRKKGLSSADKKSSRLATEGLISAYIHDSRIGCLIEVNSETDFVARNEKFKELVDDLAMQVVACPQVEFVSMDEIPESAVEKEKAIEMQREDLQSKPEQIREKIVEGRISKRLGELALLEQPFIKDDSVTVKELVKRTIASLGENIKVRRFVRFTLGENKD